MVIRKCEGVNYLSDSEYRGHVNPGPTEYNPSDRYVSKNHASSVTMRVPSRGLDKSWRFEKVNKPDVGSYQNDIQDANQSIRKATPKQKFSKMPNERFTTQYAKSKAFVPGAGNYEVEKCFKQLSRPPSANRRRR